MHIIKEKISVQTTNYNAGTKRTHKLKHKLQLLGLLVPP